MAQDHTRPDASTGRLLKTLTGHTNRVQSVCFSPNGKTIASGSNDDTIRLWDAITGKLLKSFIGHEGSVVSVCFSPNGKTIASGSGDKTVRLWDATTGKLLKSFIGHEGSVVSVCFSPNGKTIASGSSDKTVRLWDATTGKSLKALTGHIDRVRSVCFSPDGKTIASGSSDKTVRLWDATTGKPLKALTGVDRVRSVCFSPDGKTIASGSFDNVVWLWDATTGRLKRLIGHTDKVRSVGFSPDGTIIASGSSDETVRLWDATTGKYLQTLTGHMNSVVSVCFSSDGTMIAGGSSDGSILLWDVSSVDAYVTSTKKETSLSSDCKGPFGFDSQKALNKSSIEYKIGVVSEIDLEKNDDGTWYVDNCKLLDENGVFDISLRFASPYPQQNDLKEGDFFGFASQQYIGDSIDIYIRYRSGKILENISSQSVKCDIDSIGELSTPAEGEELGDVTGVIMAIEIKENDDPEPDNPDDFQISQVVMKCADGNLYLVNLLGKSFYTLLSSIWSPKNLEKYRGVNLPSYDTFGEGDVVTVMQESTVSDTLNNPSFRAFYKEKRKKRK